jgi:hypothetical protein
MPFDFDTFDYSADKPREPYFNLPLRCGNPAVCSDPVEFVLAKQEGDRREIYYTCKQCLPVFSSGIGGGATVVDVRGRNTVTAAELGILPGMIEG